VFKMATPGQFVANAMLSGYNQGVQQREGKKEQQRTLDLQSQLQEHETNIGTLQQKYSSLLGPKGEETPESLKTKYALSQALQQRDALLSPQQKPGIAGKIGQKIGEALHLAKKPEAQSTTVQPAEAATPVTESGVTLAATPEYKVPVASAPSEVPKPAAAPVQGATPPPAGEQPRRITPATEPGLPETTLPPMEAAMPAIQFGRPTTVKGPALTPAQLRMQAQNQRVQQETNLLTAAAPVSPQQQAIQQAQTGNAGMVETIRGKLDAIKAFHPEATPEELQKLNNTYLDTVLGTVTKSKPLTGSKPYKGADGKYYQAMQDALTGEITAQPMPADYMPPVGRPLSPGAQYMQALVKRSEGQTLSPEEEAALKSYPEYIRQTTVIPGVARMVAGAQARPMVVVNPDNPQQTMIVSAGQAERGKYATPASVGYQVNVAGHKALIPKGLGSNIAALATAEDHLKMANGLVDALGTGNIVALNRLSLMWSQATGDPAPTDFETVKTSLEGEMARAFTGVGATQGEIASIGSIINKANSPQALKSALNYALQTMEARRKNLWATAEQAGMTAPAGAGVPAPQPRGGGKTFTVKAPNGKTYTFRDQKSLDNFKQAAGIK